MCRVRVTARLWHPGRKGRCLAPSLRAGRQEAGAVGADLSQGRGKPGSPWRDPGGPAGSDEFKGHHWSGGRSQRARLGWGAHQGAPLVLTGAASDHDFWLPNPEPVSLAGGEGGCLGPSHAGERSGCCTLPTRATRPGGELANHSLTWRSRQCPGRRGRTPTTQPRATQRQAWANDRDLALGFSSI